MRMRASASAIAILAIAQSAIVQAQDNIAMSPVNAPVQAAADRCLPFIDALETGARIAPEIETARARLAEGEAELGIVRSLFKPQVSSFIRTGVGDRGLTDSRIENQVGLRVSQRIFDFGDARLARRAAGATLEARRFDIAAAQAQGAETVGQSYLGWLETRERLYATRQREAYFERQLGATTSLVARGGATVAEQADIDAELLDAQAGRIELEFLLERFATRLAINTRRTEEPCPPDDAAQRLSALLDVGSSVTAFIDGAKATSPQIEALRRAADSLAFAADREARSRYPVIGVTGISSYAADDFGLDGSQRNRVGIDISVPLYTGNAQTARIASARARARQATGRVGEALRDLEEEVSIGLRRIAAFRTQSARRALAAKTRAEQLAGAEIQFAAGLRTLPDLIRVRLQFEEAELARITSNYDLLRERLRLLRLVGTTTFR